LNRALETSNKKPNITACNPLRSNKSKLCLLGFLPPARKRCPVYPQLAGDEASSTMDLLLVGCFLRGNEILDDGAAHQAWRKQTLRQDEVVEFLLVELRAKGSLGVLAELKQLRLKCFRNLVTVSGRSKTIVRSAFKTAGRVTLVNLLFPFAAALRRARNLLELQRMRDRALFA
jgi:hypothetical protein